MFLCDVLVSEVRSMSVTHRHVPGFKEGIVLDSGWTADMSIMNPMQLLQELGLLTLRTATLHVDHEPCRCNRHWLTLCHNPPLALTPVHRFTRFSIVVSVMVRRPGAKGATVHLIYEAAPFHSLQQTLLT